MATLPIRDDLLSRIKRIAEERQVSVEVQAESLLIESIEKRERRAELRKLLESIAAMTPSDVKQTDSVELLREDRSR